VGAWIEQEFVVQYDSWWGLIALLHRRLGMEHRKPKAISRKLDRAKQDVFIRFYEALMNRLSVDEAVIFAEVFKRPMRCRELAARRQRRCRSRSSRAVDATD